MYFGYGTHQLNNLQGVLASNSPSQGRVDPHHPIMCSGPLEYSEDGCLSCPHAKMPADDPRTQQILNHTTALLILEEAWRAFG